VKSLGFVLMLGLGALACGDNNTKPDAAVPPMIDAAMVDSTMIDAPVVAATFTTYVIDLVKNHTDNTGASRPFSEFSALPDPDGTSNNGNGTQGVYSTLFP